MKNQKQRLEETIKATKKHIKTIDEGLKKEHFTIAVLEMAIKNGEEQLKKLTEQENKAE